MYKFTVSEKAPPVQNFTTLLHHDIDKDITLMRLEELPDDAWPLRVQICKLP